MSNTLVLYNCNTLPADFFLFNFFFFPLLVIVSISGNFLFFFVQLQSQMPLAAIAARPRIQGIRTEHNADQFSQISERNQLGQNLQLRFTTYGKLELVQR